jgi:hypothetical protein
MISMGHATMATTGVAIHEAKPMCVSVASLVGSGCSARLMAPLSPNVKEISGPVRSSGTDALSQHELSVGVMQRIKKKHTRGRGRVCLLVSTCARSIGMPKRS